MSVWKNILYIKYVIVCKLSQLIFVVETCMQPKEFCQYIICEAPISHCL